MESNDIVTLRMLHEKRFSSIMKGAVFAIILFGLVLRLGQYAANRSLWYDEALLALNIANRSFIELAQPLDYDQAAPLGFLFTQKLIVQLLGHQDYILRFFPLACGIIALYLMYKVANRYSKGVGILIALGLLATSGRIIYYTSELKQYSSDVAICLLLLLLASNLLSTSVSSKQFIVLGIAGSLSLWFSHAATFILAGIGLGLALHFWAQRDLRRLSWLGTISLLWLANLAILYFVSFRSMATHDALNRYWHTSFMPMPPWRDLSWFPAAIADMLRDPTGLSPVPIGATALLIGCWSLCTRNWQMGLILILPFPIVLLASGLELYPFSSRLLLFLVPIILLLVAEGIEWVRLVFLRVNPWVSLGAWVIPTVLLLYTPATKALADFSHPRMGEHIEPAMSYITQHRLDQDSIYVYYGAQPAFRYYAPHFDLEEEDYTIGVSSRQNPDRYKQDLDLLGGQGRVWFVFSHVYNWDAIDEEAFFLEHLDKLGTRLEMFKAPGASVYLYDLRRLVP
jgi:hypothetical protein